MQILVAKSLSEVVDNIVPLERVYLSKETVDDYRDVSEMLKHSTIYKGETVSPSDIVIISNQGSFDVWRVSSEIILSLHKRHADASSAETTLDYAVCFSDHEANPDKGEYHSVGTISIKVGSYNI